MEILPQPPGFLPLIEAAAIAAVSFFFLYLFRNLCLRFLKRAEKPKTGKKAAFRQVLESTHPLFLLFFSCFFGALWIDLGEDLDLYIRKSAFIALIILAGLWANVVIDQLMNYASERFSRKKGMSPSIIALIRTLSKGIVAATLALFILDNLNFEVSALLAGLGIGGIAIALAVQNILQDLFASVSIIIDKPFLIGDFIIVDNYMGCVEHVGIKTTRIRSLGGEQIIFSNADLLKCRLRNYKRMNERRVVFSARTTYETPVEKVKQVPAILQEAVESRENVRFDRAHLKELGTYSLDFEIVYYVLSPDYKVYMDTQQEINEHIFERFKQNGIEFAYPTAKSIRIEPK